MVDQVRNTQHYVEIAEAVDTLAARETSANLEVAYSLAQNPGNCRETSAYLEAAEAVTPRFARNTSHYLEIAYSPGPPPGDFIMDTHHFLEWAYMPLFPQINVECPFATSYIPGVVRQQTVCE